MKKNKSNKRKNNKMKKGGNIIGQGTHGTIEIDKTDNTMVIKKYVKMKANNCKMLQNEFEIQLQLYNAFDEIYVPNCCCFIETKNECSYKMERIFELETSDFYIIINMTNSSENSIKFAHSKIGHEAGYNFLKNTMNLNVEKLSFNIGKMFSKLHFVLMLDGYDCELLYGKINNTNQLCLIDYDKINKFEWKLNQNVYRKIDETTIDNKLLSTISKFAWFLYSAMVSMSLISNDANLKYEFVRGYETYLDKKNQLQIDVFNEIIEIINDF